MSDDGRMTLLLEDVAGDDRWSLEAYLLAARHLGRLSGRWLHRIPPHPWLFQGWARHHSQLPALEAGRRLVGHRLSAPPPELADVTYADARLLLDHQHRVLRALDLLPQTLCHHDAVRSNLFLRSATNGPETVAIDWELVGPGVVGADLAALHFASVRRGDLAADALEQLVEPAVDSYVDGMADMSRPVPRAAVRAGLRLATCLRWTLLRDVLVSAAQRRPSLPPGHRPRRAAGRGTPPPHGTDPLPAPGSSRRVQMTDHEPVRMRADHGRSEDEPGYGLQHHEMPDLGATGDDEDCGQRLSDALDEVASSQHDCPRETVCDRSAEQHEDDEPLRPR